MLQLQTTQCLNKHTPTHSIVSSKFNLYFLFLYLIALSAKNINLATQCTIRNVFKWEKNSSIFPKNKKETFRINALEKQLTILS